MKPTVRIIPLTLLLVFILLAGASVFGASRTITTLPYSFNASDKTPGAIDTLFLQGTRLNSNTGGITIGSGVNDVVIMLGQDTISFGRGNGDGNTGISISGAISSRPTNIKVIGGYVLHQPTDTTVTNNQCFNLAGRHILLQNITANIKGYNGRVVEGGGSNIYNVEISGGTFSSDVTGYTDRQYYDGAIVLLDNFYTTTEVSNGTYYHANIHGLTITRGPGQGIIVKGRDEVDAGIARIADCNVQLDARNDFYLSYDGLGHSSSNPYGIFLRNVGPGCLVENNTITSGTIWGGCRGIIVEYGGGTAARPIRIKNNWIEVHEGPNVEYGNDLPLHALRIRYSPQHIYVDSNTFIGYGDNSSATTETGSSVNLVRFSASNADCNVLFRNNTVRAIAQSSSGVDCQAIMFDDVTLDSLFFLENNNIESSGKIYKFGEYNGGGRGNIIHGDTVRFGSTQISPITFDVGYLSSDRDCQNNVACDVVYLGGTAPTDIDFGNVGLQDITIQRTVTVRVVGGNGSAVIGANVALSNNYGQTVLSGQTNSSGILSAPVTYWFESRSQTDSTTYNNFHLSVTKGNDSYQSDFAVNHNTVLPVCTLSNTAGEVDSIPPDPILDLGCVPGDGNGKINASWTASGDDGSSGPATYYELKYSQSAITEANWNSILTIVSNPPLPAPSGSVQGVTISGLVPGEVYYVAMRVYDDGGNASTLSNVVSSPSSINISTGGEDDDYISSTLVPQNGATVTSQHYPLSARNIVASGTNFYYFDIAADSNFFNAVVSSPPVPQSTGSFTEWEISEELEDGEVYFWRVRVNDYPYTSVSSFTFVTDGDIHPYPVPSKPGESVYFTLMTEPGNLLITTVSGETVVSKKSVSGTWVWDGRNDAGQPVAVGVYLWSFEVGGKVDGGSKGKLAVKP